MFFKCLIDNNSTLLDNWIAILVDSKAPILRRLAIYTMSLHPDKSPDKSPNENLYWLFKHVDFDSSIGQCYEIYNVMAIAYPGARAEARQAVVKRILAHKSPASKTSSAEEQTVKAHYKWLTWLQRTTPDCKLIQEALVPIEKRYPEWQPPKYPYHLISGSPLNFLDLSTKSPWTVEKLLSKRADEWIDDLLNFKDNLLK